MIKLFSKALSGLILFLCSISFSTILLAEGLPVKSANKDNEISGLEELVNRLEKIETIAGEFIQYTVDQKGTRVQDSRGEFKAKRPGLFYWYTSQPLEQAIYSDGEKVTIYDPDLEQATIQKMDQSVQSTPAVLFSGDVHKIGEQFEVERRKWDDIVTQYLLVPKNKEGLFDKLLIRFDGQQITEMRLSDSLGQESTVSFIHTAINIMFEKDAFSPNFPEGTDIIEDIPHVGSIQN